MHLDIHLENGQRIYFTILITPKKKLNPQKQYITCLFELCQNDDFANTLFYHEVSSYYTLNKKNGTFDRRKIGETVKNHPNVKKSESIGRTYTIHPKNKEYYFLRMLLNHIKGPTSYKYLKTVNGIEFETFQDACEAYELLGNNKTWEQTLEEAPSSDSPRKLRNLFVVILIFCNVSKPIEKSSNMTFQKIFFKKNKGNK